MRASRLEFWPQKPLARARPGHPRLEPATISAPKTWMAGPSPATGNFCGRTGSPPYNRFRFPGQPCPPATDQALDPHWLPAEPAETVRREPSAAHSLTSPAQSRGHCSAARTCHRPAGTSKRFRRVDSSIHSAVILLRQTCGFICEYRLSNLTRISSKISSCSRIALAALLEQHRRHDVPKPPSFPTGDQFRSDYATRSWQFDGWSEGFGSAVPCRRAMAPIKSLYPHARSKGAVYRVLWSQTVPFVARINASKRQT